METQKKLKLGILGGGQLAQMLAENNPFTDLEIRILSEIANCPASYTNAILSLGSPHSAKDLELFIEQVDFITFENEFVNIDLLQEIQRKFPRKIFYPQLSVIKVIQNKLNQKYIFKKLQLPTSTFHSFEPSLENISDWCTELLKKYSSGCMIKWAHNGYDGKGNFLLESKDQIQKAIEFCQFALEKNVQIYAESRVNFQKELSMIFARSLKGTFIHYPLVISEQKNSICKTVFGPATEFGVSKDVENLAIEYGKKIANEFSYVGVFAIEFFLTEKNELLINEVAPRVHNSGHYTLDACLLNQFSCHIKSGLGAELQMPSYFPFFAMQNLIGTKNISQSPKPEVSPNDPFKLYWYNKQESIPGRKLGHINTVATSRDDLIFKIKKMKDFENKNY